MANGLSQGEASVCGCAARLLCGVARGGVVELGGLPECSVEEFREDVVFSCGVRDTDGLLHVERCSCFLQHGADLVPHGRFHGEAELLHSSVSCDTDDTEHLCHLEPHEQPLGDEEYVLEFRFGMRDVVLGELAREHERRLHETTPYFPHSFERVHVHDVFAFVRPAPELARERTDPVPVLLVAQLPRVRGELVADFRVDFHHELVYGLHERVQHDAHVERHVRSCHATRGHVAKTHDRAFLLQIFGPGVVAPGGVLDRQTVAQHLLDFAGVLLVHLLGRLWAQADEHVHEHERGFEQPAEFDVVAFDFEFLHVRVEARCALCERVSLARLHRVDAFACAGRAKQTLTEHLVVEDGDLVFRHLLDPDHIASEERLVVVRRLEDAHRGTPKEIQRDVLTLEDERDTPAFVCRGCGLEPARIHHDL